MQKKQCLRYVKSVENGENVLAILMRLNNNAVHKHLPRNFLINHTLFHNGKWNVPGSI